MNNLFNPTAGVELQMDLTSLICPPGSLSANSNTMKLMASIQSSIAISNDFGIESNVYLNGPSGVFYIFNMGASFTDLTAKLEARNASEAWQEYWGNAQIQRAGQFVRQAWITRVAVD